jgi:hypothetical protein
MARVTYSGLITSFNGSIGGTTFQNNHYGFTVRNKPKVIKPQSKTQRGVQAYMSSAVRSWSALTNVQRASWVTFASTFPQASKHNPLVTLTGYNLFCKIHVLRFIAHLAVLTTPTMSTLAPETVTPTIKVNSTTINLILNYALDDGSFGILCYISGVRAQSKTFKTSFTRFIYSDTNFHITQDITTKYLNIFGVLPKVGEQVLFTYQLFGGANGQVLAPYKQFLTCISI